MQQIAQRDNSQGETLWWAPAASTNYPPRTKVIIIFIKTCDSVSRWFHELLINNQPLSSNKGQLRHQRKRGENTTCPETEKPRFDADAGLRPCAAHSAFWISVLSTLASWNCRGEWENGSDFSRLESITQVKAGYQSKAHEPHLEYACCSPF